MNTISTSIPTSSAIVYPLVSVNRLKRLLFAFPLFTYAVSFVKDWIISILRTGPIPKHIALIMDGNRTFAKRNNLSLKQGHISGAESLLHILDASYKLGIEQVTIYAFSIENFNRSKEEVDTLFGLLRERLNFLSENEDSYTRHNKVRVKIIGNRSMIPQDILTNLEEIEEKTRNSVSSRVLNVCFPYTSRDDITHSIKSVVEERIDGAVGKEDISDQLLTDNMYYGPNTPDLDIMIRTSGHTRLSDFMIWQCNENCTIEFVSTLWPDFKFMGLILILLKWGYYKTMETERVKFIAKNPVVSKPQKNIFKELPPHPPHKSVSNR